MSMIKDSDDWRNGLNASQVAYYDEMPLARAVCRGSFRHHFHLNDPKSLGSPDVPEGMEIIPQADGTCEVRDHCIRECGRYASYLTDEAGAILWDTRELRSSDRAYIATGLDLTRADDRRFLQHVQQQALAMAIGRRIKIARRAALQSVATAG